MCPANRRKPKTWLRLGGALLAAIVLWQGVAEAIEPFHTLALWGWLTRHQQGYLGFPAIAESELRVYQSPRPHIGKIARLQKGLVWAWRGQELIQEGYGFGLPLVIHKGQTYCARQATVSSHQTPLGTRIIKRYLLDTVDTPIRLLRRKYRQVDPIGEVVVTYDLASAGEIEISVDFSQVAVTWERAYLMNEQGANWFTRYNEGPVGASSPPLSASQLGIWQSSQAERACFSSDRAPLRFCIEIEPDEGVTLQLGRERYWQRNWRGLFYLAWAGADIEIGDQRDVYTYRLLLEQTTP